MWHRAWNRDGYGNPYIPADIGLVENHSLIGQANHGCFEPQTYLFHSFIIRSYLRKEDDYEIIEMLGGIFPWQPSGCRIGRLSDYKNRRFVVFRLNDPDIYILGKEAAKDASKFGKSQYDFGLFFKLPADCFRCWFWQLIHEHKFRRIRPDELKLVWDKVFVCTELPKAIMLEIGKTFLKGAAIPSAYVQAFKDDRLTLVG